jgi:glutathione-independent formaldehyde dehydrogenase
VVGVYPEKDLDPAQGGTPDGHLTVPWGTFFTKSVTLRFGRTNDRRYTTFLRDMVTSGAARPGRIVTHHAGLDEAPGLYREFDRREHGVIKAVLHP